MTFKTGVCKRCGNGESYVTATNGQDVVRCRNCDQFDWCLPKSVSGKPQRTVRSRERLRPSDRAHILGQHGHACISCGRTPPSIILHVDHIIPVDAAKRAGVYDELIEDIVNLAPMCEECNLGNGAHLSTKSVRLMYRAILLKRSEGSA